MIKRPKPGEDEEDLLRMQEEFLEEQRLRNIQPAAQVTNLRPTESLKRPRASVPESSGSRKPSKYAQSKGLKGQSEKQVRFDIDIMGEICEKSFEENLIEEADDDKVYYPNVIPSLLGDIIEKNVDEFVDIGFKNVPAEGFPVAYKCNSNMLNKLEGSDLKTTIEKMDLDEASTSNSSVVDKNLPSRSYMLSSKEANDIHNENIKLLSNISEKEILEEQKKLLSNLHPTLVEFIKAKRQINSEIDEKTIDIKENKIKEATLNINYIDDKMDTTVMPETDSLWENDVLSHPEIEKWLHFDSLEKDKLEWMTSIEESTNIKANEPYEARFDFKGYLLPYVVEYSEKTKSLFHHGDEPHRPGYSITELIKLSRSTVIQQRVMALKTLAGILEYHSAGTYKDIIEIPVTKLFFILRIAMDENKVIILEPALKAMRNLIYNRIDEAILDALIGFEAGNTQPCLDNDKLEIEELESKESELKDFHLAEIDIIAALLRTDILQRLFYILDTVRPPFNCVHYCLQILIRLARDSVDTCKKIVETNLLMNTIINNFIPNTSINFIFDPQIVYNGKPIISALKLFRILSLQCHTISKILITKYDILAPISNYISSVVEWSYGMKIQIEAYCILSNLLQFGLGKENTIALCPVIITSIYKHVQGTDIYVESSLLSATHASVILQLLSVLLKCNFDEMGNYKSQIYCLIRDGSQKWIGQLSQADSYTCGHLRLISSVLDCCRIIFITENIPLNLLNDSLNNLSQSQGFENITKNIVLSSNLLSGLQNKDLQLTKNLMSLGGSVIESSHKVLPILNVLSPIPFLSSLFNVLTYVNDKEISQSFLRHLLTYLKKLSNKAPFLCDNWFTRIETDLIFNIVKLSTQYGISEGSKDLIYTIANKLVYILRIDKKTELDFLFSTVLFNKHWFTAERLLHLVNLSDAENFSKALTSIEDIKLCYSKVVNVNYKDTGPNIVFTKWQEPILPRDWIYLPILTLYSKSQESKNIPKVFGKDAKVLATQMAAEKEFIINCSLEWILFNELCFPDLLNDIDITDRFCRIMCVFLCDNSVFLDSKIKILLQKCVQTLFEKKLKFNFDKPLIGLNNFQDFYTQILEQFQSVSYGDQTFAACVLVPLAQKHNIKWRKLLWSEYAGCLRALDCPKEMLCYDLNEYLYPEETDESLLRSYFNAISDNLVRQRTIAHKIASHHVDSYKKRSLIKK